IALLEPFLYNPALGNLLLDVFNVAGERRPNLMPKPSMGTRFLAFTP
ncbi:MAG: hypothetical protein HC881_04390, partial [Leptolyngbyaceae cyanobacterium SL_7_1]|nr:hypothetical protein [Leptolyngbyaceae cyanobacterium SL_7_1]